MKCESVGCLQMEANGRMMELAAGWSDPHSDGWKRVTRGEGHSAGRRNQRIEVSEFSPIRRCLD